MKVVFHEQPIYRGYASEEVLVFARPHSESTLPDGE